MRMSIFLKKHSSSANILIYGKPNHEIKRDGLSFLCTRIRGVKRASRNLNHRRRVARCLEYQAKKVVRCCCSAITLSQKKAPSPEGGLAVMLSMICGLKFVDQPTLKEIFLDVLMPKKMNFVRHILRCTREAEDNTDEECHAISKWRDKL